MSIILDSNEKPPKEGTIIKFLKDVVGFFRPEGSYNRKHYIVISTVSVFILILLLVLRRYQNIFGYFLIPYFPLYLYINYISYRKTLRGGEKLNWLFHFLFVPFSTSSFLGGNPDADKEEQEYRDYKIRDYDRKHSRHNDRKY